MKLQKSLRNWRTFRVHSRQVRIVTTLTAMALLLIGLKAAVTVGANVDSPVFMEIIRANLRVLFRGTNSADFPAAPPEIIASYGYTTGTIAYLALRARAILQSVDFDPFDAASIPIRNAITFLISLGAYLAVYISAKVTSRSRVAGWLAVSFLSLSPAFVGNSFFNDKDIPLATGYTLIVAASLIAVQNYWGSEIGRLTSQGPSLLGVGLVLSLGTRPGIWPVALLLILVTVGLDRSRRNIYYISLGCVVMFLVSTNGFLLRRPTWWFSNAISIASDFPYDKPVLLGGKFTSPTNGWFGPAILFDSTPLVILIGVCFSFILFVRKAGTGPDARITTIVSIILYATAFGPVTLGSIRNSSVYDGARQYLFVFPLLAVIAATAFCALLSSCARKMPRAGIHFVLAIGLVSPLIASVQLYPYLHVYSNEFAMTRPGPSDNWIDNQGVSAREAQLWINEHLNHRKQAALFPQNFSPYMEENQLVDPSDIEMTVYTQIYRPTLIPDYYIHCPLVHEVSRKLFGQKRILSYVRLCGDVSNVSPFIQEQLDRLNPQPPG